MKHFIAFIGRNSRFYLLCTHQHWQMPHKNSAETNKIQFAILLSIYSFVCFACVRTECKCMMGASGFIVVVFMIFRNEKVHRQRMYRSMHKQWHAIAFWKENEFSIIRVHLLAIFYVVGLRLADSSDCIEYRFGETMNDGAQSTSNEWWTRAAKSKHVQISHYDGMRFPIFHAGDEWKKPGNTMESVSMYKYVITIVRMEITNRSPYIMPHVMPTQKPSNFQCKYIGRTIIIVLRNTKCLITIIMPCWRRPQCANNTEKNG